MGERRREKRRERLPQNRPKLVPPFKSQIRQTHSGSMREVRKSLSGGSSGRKPYCSGVCVWDCLVRGNSVDFTSDFFLRKPGTQT